ncbi:MAG: hypothetical protein GWM87_04725, partial [Xanthomonadales bacterium]|nr:hypothetical protein [Xanthomonadales bacterium]NIX12312.1 hypothetical protein [Xanthomonadales bacterium]
MAASVIEVFSRRDTSRAPRFAIGIALGLVITLFLFWFMQYMIETADRSLDESKRGSLVDFVRVQRDES